MGEESDSASVSSRVSADSGQWSLLDRTFSECIGPNFPVNCLLYSMPCIRFQKRIVHAEAKHSYAMCAETTTLKFGLAIGILALADVKRDKS
jgi:hypothetical protein